MPPPPPPGPPPSSERHLVVTETYRPPKPLFADVVEFVVAVDVEPSNEPKFKYKKM